MKTIALTLYKSALCPRCYMAGKHLQELLSERPDITLQTVDVLVSPGKALKDGVRMIPAIKAEDKQLSGVYLSKKHIAGFLKELQSK